jgi:endonuclease III
MVATQVGFVTTDPETCTTYNREDAQLQEFLIFCICVAGKTARVVQESLKKFWPKIIPLVTSDGYFTLTPFQIMNRWISLYSSPKFAQGALATKLKECGIGCHKLKSRGIIAIARAQDLDLCTATPEELEKFPGIGPKTSRFFILHSRKEAKVACLDVHILRWMRTVRRLKNVPRQTPQSRPKYKALEKRFLHLVPKGKTVAEFDLEIWMEFSRKIKAKS